ncbi:MAG TPA: histidine phosphatase family protein, partial [Streptosporangiaceae bacterium]|nr:histidine phosphatase family protein [Streptosporangiaceae bacterium]
ALQLIGSRHPGEAVAAVTHAVMIRLVLAKLSGTGGENWRIPVRRGSVTELRARDGTFTLAGQPGEGARPPGAAAPHGVMAAESALPSRGGA